MSSKVKSSTLTGGGYALLPERRFPEFHEAWENVSLGSVASISAKKVGDKTCVPMSITSGVGLVSQMEKFGRIIAGDSYKNYLLLQKNDFAYNKSATKEYPEGFIALYTGEELAAVPNSIFTCFRIKGEAASPKYLNYLFLGNLHGRWLRKFIEVGARAHGSLSINNSDLLAMPVPVPAGPNALKEQQKIADCLASADALIAVQGRKVRALRAHKKGLMQQLFPEEGEIQPRLRFPEFEGAGEWVPQSLKQVTTALLDGDWIESKDQSEDGFRLIQTGNIGVGDFIAKSGKARFVSNETFERLRCTEVFPGDCLVSRLPDPLGRSCFIPDIGERMITAVDCLIVRFDETKIVPRLFVALTQTDAYFRNVAGLSSGSTRQRISKENLSNLSFIIPPTILEQQRIADCLTSLDDLIAAETQKLDTLKTHKKGLMQQLFPLMEKV